MVRYHVSSLISFILSWLMCGRFEAPFFWKRGSSALLQKLLMKFIGMWHFIFWILYLYRFNLHVHWQKAITKKEKNVKKKLPRRATRVMTCWLTASLQQWRLQATCVMSRGLGNSPRWASLNWAHCSLTSKFIFPCVQNRMWKKK